MSGAGALAALVERIVAAAAAGTAASRPGSRSGWPRLGQGCRSDPQAIAQEIVRFAQRSDITEEVVRFRAHLAQWDGADRRRPSRAAASSTSWCRR